MIIPYTPGPWTYNRDTENDKWRIMYVETDGHNTLGSVSKESDAKLVASAPDLLDCVYGLMIACESLDINHDEVMRARLIIRRATGAVEYY